MRGVWRGWCNRTGSRRTHHNVSKPHPTSCPSPHPFPTIPPTQIPKYAFVAKEFLEPERIIQFRVSWLDDAGAYRMNRGWRVQYSSALGPYEGGLHFHKDMSASLVKSQAFTRVFTNALTGCELGAAVGGADFNPHNKSEAEIQRFCQVGRNVGT